MLLIWKWKIINQQFLDEFLEALQSAISQMSCGRHPDLPCDEQDQGALQIYGAGAG